MPDPRTPPALTGDRNWALFLDVDGTLLDIQEHPDQVFADRDLQQMIDDLSTMHSGAVALISGRSLSQLDRIFGTLQIPAAGSHGHELRFPDGSVENHEIEIPRSCVEALEAFALERKGLHLEQKPNSIALHYRAAASLAGEAIDKMTATQQQLGDEFSLIHGKMVVELLPAFADKGSAIRHFVTIEPFAGRQPVFIGDDISDEAGFAAANKLGGHSIRIGASADSAAQWYLSDVAGLHEWIRNGLDNYKK